MVFRVFDREGYEITNEYSWVITSEGKICFRNYDGDLIIMNGVSAILDLGSGFSKTIFNEDEEI